MNRLTLGQAKETIAEVLGVCATDPSVARYANEAQQRILNRSTDAVGSWQRYRVCTNASGCVVMPRQVLHVKAWWQCNEPGLVLPEWWETLGYWNGGRGLLECDNGNCEPSLVDRGTVVSFDNVTGATSTEKRKIQVLATDTTDNGKFIILRYFDEFGQRVYTSIDGTVQEGERLAMTTSGVLTSRNVMTGGLYGVLKATTNYPVRLYGWDVNSAVQANQMALYEPSETTPSYRQYFSSRFTSTRTVDDEDCSDYRPLTFAVRLRHIPVVVDNDFFIVGNLPALKDMVQSILMRKRHEYAAARELEASALAEIDGEIASYLGDGASPVIRMPDVSIWGGGGIFNPVY